MMLQERDEFLWAQKYRPRKIDDCILPERMKTLFKEFLEQGQIPHFLFSGPAGIGKTTVAMALCAELGADFLFINGSEESGIDVLRGKVKKFASTMSLSDQKKIVLIDEADYLNANSTQPAMRSLMEEFSSNCRFILTCNLKHKIIEPLHSRCTVVDFKIEADEKKSLMTQMAKRCVSILEQENIEYDKAVIAPIVQRTFPDFRKLLNKLQEYSVIG